MRIFLLFGLVYCFFLPSFGQKPDFKFKHLTASNGLSHSFIRNIIQDSQGYIWVATPHGLNKFDGYNFIVYKNDPKNKYSIFSNDIWEILEDSQNRLWVGTREGFGYYSKSRDGFVLDTIIGDKHVNFIFEDRSKKLWVSTIGGLYCYNNSKKAFSEVTIEGLNGNVTSLYEDQSKNLFIGTEQGVFVLENQTNKAVLKFPLKRVTSFYEDDDQNLWVGSRDEGLVRYDLKNKEIKVFKQNELNSEGLLTNKILRIKGDSSYLYIGTENAGLMVYDKKKEEFHHYLNNPSDPESISFNSIYSIFLDDDNNVWIGTFSGLDRIKKNKFQLIRHKLGDPKSLNHNNILCFSEDEAGNLWIGTDGGGINYFNRKENSFEHFKGDPENPLTIGANAATFLKEDRQGHLWVGTWTGGLNLFDKEKKQFQRFLPDPSNPESIMDANVVFIHEEESGNLWLGTSSGINYFDKATKKFTNYSTPENELNTYVSYIYEDKEGTLWVGTFKGLYILDKKTKKTTAYVYEDSDKNSISSNIIFSIFEDSKGNFWIGTLGGLNLFDRRTNTFRAFREKHGLPSDAAMNIEEDKDGNLWIATTLGLSKFNPVTKTFKNYNISDGLQDNEFKQNAHLKLKTGELVYGGPNGFNIFYPNNLTENKTIPPIVITNFSIFNKVVPIGTENSPLSQHITYTKEITLSHEQSVLSFDFAALNYISPEKNQYAYKLVGLEKEWNYVGNKKSATYTNLDPGEYLFWVKGSNNDGYWNEEGVKLKIVITPPNWNTWWFKLLAAIVAISGLFGIYRVRVKIIERQKRQLETQVKERTIQLHWQTEVLETANEELNKQKEEIVSQAEFIERIYNETKDSIRAAQIIQQMTLPEEAEIRKNFSDFFILNKPKDVVSGDFYWFTTQENKILIAAVDCIGHGVSGAFMSIHGHHLLKQSILSNKQLVASEILDKLNEDLIIELHQKTASNENLISMDISFCIIDKVDKTLQFSGANGVIYIIRENSLIQLKGDKFPVGLSNKRLERKYKNNEFKLNDGDVIYLFSDGYPDQIGGPNLDEKYMYPRFRKILSHISSKQMCEQKNILEKELEDWRGEFEQIDDVLVIGIRI